MAYKIILWIVHEIQDELCHHDALAIIKNKVDKTTLITSANSSLSSFRLSLFTTLIPSYLSWSRKKEFPFAAVLTEGVSVIFTTTPHRHIFPTSYFKHLRALYPAFYTSLIIDSKLVVDLWSYAMRQEASQSQRKRFARDRVFTDVEI